MRSLGQNPTDDEIEEWIIKVDRDQDGQISRDDFMKIMSLKIKSSGKCCFGVLFYRRSGRNVRSICCF